MATSYIEDPKMVSETAAYFDISPADVEEADILELASARIIDVLAIARRVTGLTISYEPTAQAIHDALLKRRLDVTAAAVDMIVATRRALYLPFIKLGKVVATPGALLLGVNFLDYIRRHRHGDWGDLCDSDKRANDEASVNGGRILSAYETPAGKIWIITEWDRSATTVLLPSEY